MARTIYGTLLRVFLPLLLCALLGTKAVNKQNNNDVESLSSIYYKYAGASFCYLQMCSSPISATEYKSKTPVHYLENTESTEKQLLAHLIAQNDTSTHVNHFITHWFVHYQHQRLYETTLQLHKVQSLKSISEQAIWDGSIVRQSLTIYDYNKFSELTNVYSECVK
ncbi:Hypothetical predicted protein [Octopus vulgaris]|uniref:Uncharacterized protein n=1 Tax=Octopus vulgaris TaxID=6645 RepID=A0AA36FCL0_OCTVU|nr:Hypothetical predicted protein [Octopus vulgaris]